MSNAGAIRAGQAFIEAYLDKSQLDKDLDGLMVRIKSFGTTMRSVGLGIAAAGSAILAPLTLAVHRFRESGDALDKMSQRTGVSTNALSELGYAAEMSGSSLDDLEGIVRKMQKTISEAAGGGQAAQQSLASLGITAQQLAGLSPDQQFELLAERLSEISDPTLRAARAMDIFGKSGTSILPMIAKGAAGIRAMREEAKSMGLSVDPAEATAAAELDDSMTKLRFSVGALYRVVATAVVPAVQDFVAWITGAVQATRAWVAENQSLVSSMATVGATAAVAGVSLTAIGTVASALNNIWNLAKNGLAVLAALKAAFVFVGAAAIPIVGILAALAVAGAVVYTSLRKQTAATYELSDSMKQQKAARDQQRADDMDAMDRLNQLAVQQKLDSRQKAEAAAIIAQLEGRYGALGVTLDTVTGKIYGAANAQNYLTDRMKLAARLDNAARIRQIDESLAKLDRAGRGHRNQGTQFGAEADQIRADRLELLREREQLEQEAELRRNGQSAEQVAAKDFAGQQRIETRKRLGELEEEFAAKLLTAEERELQAIRKQGEERKKQMQEELDAQLELHRADESRIRDLREGLEMADAWTAAREEKYHALQQQAEEEKALAHVQEVERERKRAQEQQTNERTQTKLDLEKAAAEEVEDLEIEARFAGQDNDKQLKRAKLELEERRELEAAAEAGADPTNIRRRFALRRQIMDEEDKQRPPTSRALDIQGTFSAAAALRLGASSNPIVTEQKKTNTALEKWGKKFDRLVQAAERGPQYR